VLVPVGVCMAEFGVRGDVVAAVEFELDGEERRRAGAVAVDAIVWVLGRRRWLLIFCRLKREDVFFEDLTKMLDNEQ